MPEQSSSTSILVVEDSLTQALMLEETLSSRGFVVNLARDGEEALFTLRNQQCDIVISDVIMPGMDGFELCRTIRNDNDLSSIPVILLTSLSDPEDIVRGLASGASSFVTKPFDEAFLFSRIEYLLENRSTNRPEDNEEMEIVLRGESRTIYSNKKNMVDLLLGTYEHTLLQSQELDRSLQRNREREALLRGVLASLSAHITVVDSNARVIATNDAWDHFPLPEKTIPKEMRLEYVRQTLLPQNLAGAGLLSILQKKKNKFEIEYPFVSSRGRIWFQVVVTPLPDDIGGAVISHVNITGRKRAEEALLHTQAGLAKAQELAKMGNFELDLHTHTMSWSDQVYHLFGTNQLSLHPTRDVFIRFFSKNERPRLISWIDDIVSGKIAADEEFSLNRERIVRIQAEVERDADGTPFRLLGIMQDVTDKRRLIKQLIEAKEAAEQASQVKAEFLANMSHEIRTPLNGVIGMTELALMTDLSAEQNEYLTMVKNSAESLLGIINDILDFTKIEAGKLQLTENDVDIGRLLTDALKPLMITAKGKGLEFYCQVGDTVPTCIRTDPVRLRQILINLVGNAVKFTETGSITIHVEYHTHKEYGLVFTVADTGIGIPDEKISTIFESFTQLDGSLTRRHEGTGLGLAICKQLVELMGGGISVSSDLQNGTKFTFSLPTKTLKTDATVCPPPQPEPQPPLPQLRILLAEDNQVNLRFATVLLEKQGHEVTTAVNGQEALDALATSHFDIVLMDVQMPVLDGEEATRRIRRGEDGINPAIPIIALTAHAMSGDKERFLRAGMDGYVQKPLDSSTLFKVIANILNATPSTASELDLNALKAALGNNTDQMYILLKLFEEMAPSLLQSITDAIEDNDMDMLVETSHSLKGAAGNIRAYTLYEQASQLEQAARENKTTNFHKLIDTMKHTLGAVNRIISNTIPHHANV
ncbi:response regulator [Desulfovibrio inopinatus]|uniref:response regulator n=1 Tax=Desulfovibrio inopinatus TaxID=102109 RepID=UPI0003FA8A97|nr:response regulator [Desulfovibrio inopinatus]